jgi:tRNA modification GTPase
VTETIYALSSGAPPAAIAIVRISGGRADAALQALAGRLPEPRKAALVTVRSGGEVLDRAVAIRFPGPNNATGEDLAELHLHGGRAVVASVLRALGEIEGLREAEPGEFTRRAFENGRIDLAEAEGLADLLAAETQAQRRAAQLLAGGALSRNVEGWRSKIVGLAAELEAALDFGDEGDVGEELPGGWPERLASVSAEMNAALALAPAERLRDGLRVAIAGPPNAGKSSLMNALAGREAAITSDVAGTTRDVVEAPTAIGGVAFLLTDTAGLRESDDPVEVIGVARARQAVEAADIVLWLGAPDDAPYGAIIVHSKADLVPAHPLSDIAVSAVTGAGLDALVRTLTRRSRLLLPGEGEVALNARHRGLLGEGAACLGAAGETSDLLVAAEALRGARVALDRITGRAGVEDMLDALFGRFCVGK